jgi:hypothetical protein
MKISCRCGNVFTEILRPFKKLASRPDRYSDEKDGNDNRLEYYNPKGTFESLRARKYSWSEKDSGIEGYYRVIHEPAVLVVPQESVLTGKIPEMPQGYGCCNWSMGEPLKCGCGREVARLYLDCYESKTVQFLTKQIVRVYPK